MVGATEQPRRLLGQILIEMGLISQWQLEQALEEQRETGQFLGEILIAHGYVTRGAIGDALRVQRSLLVEPEPGLGGTVETRDTREHETLMARPAGAWIAQGRAERPDR